MNDPDGRTQTVAITGASGLLGRHLCDYFRAKGWRVRALVRNITQYPFTEDGIDLYHCDLPDTIDVKSIEAADSLVHCAYMTRFTSLKQAEQVNVVGTRRVYEAARSAGVKRFVFVSTVSASASAKSYYGRSKHSLESTMDASRDLIVRPGLVLASDGGLFCRIAEQVRSLPVIPVFSGGRQVLNTVHIDDLCSVFGWAMETGICGVITVAESLGITMRDLLREVMLRLGRRKPIVSVPGRPCVLVLQLAEHIGLRLPVSSENLKGLLDMDATGLFPTDDIKRSGIRIRHAAESIKELIS
jgi:nucleoside-diphosphate-sugar epimerase